MIIMGDFIVVLNTPMNLQTLNNGLHKFYIMYGYNLRIICSKKTIDSIQLHLEEIYEKYECSAKGRIGTYTGHKILEDNTLPLGVVKLK